MKDDNEKNCNRLPPVRCSDLLGIIVQRVVRVAGTGEQLHRCLALQDRFLSLMVAAGTEPMRWLTRCVRRLQSVNQNPRFKFVKLITLTLLAPALVCFYLLLEAFIGIQCRLITLRQRQLFLRYVQQGSGEFQFEFPNLGRVPSVKDCLRYVYSVAYGGDECGDFIHGRDLMPNDPAQPRGTNQRKKLP